MINARQMPLEVGWARLKLTEPLLYFKLLQLLGLRQTKKMRGLDIPVPLFYNYYYYLFFFFLIFILFFFQIARR